VRSGTEEGRRARMGGGGELKECGTIGRSNGHAEGGHE
jgi:hypothetical protein